MTEVDCMTVAQKAMIFAAQAHDGQYRKGTTIPYIVHPFEVVQILQAAGGNEVLIAAGFLHDVVEDTDISISQIRSSFGGEIAELVAHHTEDKSLSWEQRKSNKIKGLKDASFNHLLLTCADKLSNMRSIAEDYQECREGLWKRFCRGRDAQHWYYKAVIKNLEMLRDYPMYQELNGLYQNVFGKE